MTAKSGFRAFLLKVEKNVLCQWLSNILTNNETDEWETRIKNVNKNRFWKIEKENVQHFGHKVWINFDKKAARNDFK